MPPSHRELFLGMQQVALSAFGGGLSAWSQRIVVEQRQWMSNEAFLTGLTVARLFPGPNQVNMAVYIGSRFHGLTGALAALAGVITAAAGMALSMGFKIAGSYSRDPVALVLAAIAFVAMDVFHVRLVPLVLLAGPLAMAWYWPRPGGAKGAPE